jgi:DNA-binding transcriptional regulator YdaS (Cro superfamily)
MDDGLKKAVAAAGSMRKLAWMLGLAPASVSNWGRKGKGIPLDRVLEVEEATKVPREELRPDVFRRDCKLAGRRRLANTGEGS